MNISYASNKLARSLINPRTTMATYGTRAKNVSKRMQELIAAPTLETMRSFPQANCHELHGGALAVDISANYRITFRPAHDPLPRKDDGGLDWMQVTAITIMTIEDYH